MEDNLEEAGGGLLPGLQWCPWGTRVLQELGNVTAAEPTSAAMASDFFVSALVSIAVSAVGLSYF